jgi:transcriptional regulator GlxA family with amidase domain
MVAHDRISLEHLTQWRMVRAASMMRESRPAKLTAIAGAVGYESDSAFGKVFRRVMGISPGLYRRDQRVDGAIGPKPHRPKTKAAAQGM